MAAIMDSRFQPMQARNRGFPHAALVEKNKNRS
jgi:hypothetical protein